MHFVFRNVNSVMFYVATICLVITFLVLEHYYFCWGSVRDFSPTDFNGKVVIII